MPAAVTEIPVLDHDAVLAAVSPAAAIERVREALVRFHRGEWTMPPKVYLQSPSARRLPRDAGARRRARAAEVDHLVPGQPRPRAADRHRAVCLSDAGNGEPADAARRPLGDGAAHRRRGRRRDARRSRGRTPDESGIIGCGLHGRVDRPLPGRRRLHRRGSASTPGREAARRARRRSSAGRPARARTALDCEIVCCVTPGREIVLDAADLRPGQHLNMLGADGPGKAEASVGAVASCALFCDEWEQASHGGELTGAVRAGMVTRAQVTELGAVLAGAAPGRPGPQAVTLFDSTGLAIQDLAVAIAALEAWRAGRVRPRPCACNRPRATAAVHTPGTVGEGAPTAVFPLVAVHTIAETGACAPPPSAYRGSGPATPAPRRHNPGRPPGRPSPTPPPRAGCCRACASGPARAWSAGSAAR